MTWSLFDSPVTVGSSRVKGAHVILRRLPVLRGHVIKLAGASLRTLRGRGVTGFRASWLSNVHSELCEISARLSKLVADGQDIVTKYPEPRIDKRARKRR